MGLLSYLDVPVRHEAIDEEIPEHGNAHRQRQREQESPTDAKRHPHYLPANTPASCGTCAAGDHAAIVWPLLCGLAKAKYYLMLCDPISGEEAERIGLVSRVVPDAQLLDAALATADQICAHSPHGVAMTKRVLWSNLETGSLHAAMDLEARNQLLVRMTTNNLDEAIRARKEGRKPTYTD